MGLVGGVLGLRGASTGVRRCGKAALFSLLLGKFGELPKWAPLREEKQVSREAAERRGLGAAVPGDSPDPPGRSTGGKAAASLRGRTVPAKGGSGLCISVGLAGPTCCAGAVRGSESLSKSCPLCSMSEVTAGLGCVKDLQQLALEPSELLVICIRRLGIPDLGSGPSVRVKHAPMAAQRTATRSFCPPLMLK